MHTQTCCATNKDDLKTGKIAKALLLGQTCDNCKHRQKSQEFGDFSLCRVNAEIEMKEDRVIVEYKMANNKTCEKWEKITK